MKAEGRPRPRANKDKADGESDVPRRLAEMQDRSSQGKRLHASQSTRTLAGETVRDARVCQDAGCCFFKARRS